MLAAATSAPGFWDWSLDPALGLIALTALLYRAGGTRAGVPPRLRTERRWQSLCFYAALALLVLALNSPLEALSGQLFWVHMIQHVLLLLVCPPLLVIARPWMRLWRALPLGWRRPLARWLGSSPHVRPVHAIASARGQTGAGARGSLRSSRLRSTSWLRASWRTLGRPVPSLVLFCAVLAAWHMPALFDATLRSGALHALEHTLFLASALMFWKQVIPSPPLRLRLAPQARVLYLVAAMIASWALAVVLALAPQPLYAHYAHEAARPGGISALADQQIAAGIMWVPGSVAFLAALFVYLNRWLSPAPAPASRLAGGTSR
jgi:putative membrane protein